MSRYAVPTDRVEAILDIREANAALRQIARGDGRTRATLNAQFRWQRIAQRAERFLLEVGERHLVGLLAEEDSLVVRLAGLAPGERPELRLRLRDIRREIRSAQG